MRFYYRLNRGYGLKGKATIIFLLLMLTLTVGVGKTVESQFNRILREQLVETTTRNIDSVVSQLEEQTSTVEDIANYLIFSPDLKEYLLLPPRDFSDHTEDLKESIEGFLTFHLMSKKYIRSISIDGYNGSFIETGEPVKADEEKWTEEAVLRRGGVVWSEGYTASSDWNGDIRVLSLFRVLNSYTKQMMPQANLTIRMDEENVEGLLEHALYKKSGYVFVVGPNGENVLRSDDAIQISGSIDPTELIDIMESKGTRFLNYEVDQKKYMTFHRPMENTGWDVIVMFPESIVDEGAPVVIRIITLIFVMILLIGLAALIGLHYTIIRPILRLKNETNRVKRGDFTAHVPIKSNDEISDLNRNFNEMVMTIRELIDHKYKQELHDRESELKLLQNQMDPHFLYNTLDMIRWTARLEKAGKTSHLIEALSKFFRSSLNNGQYVTTILQELEFVQSYLFLQEKRLGKRFRFSLFTEYHIAQSSTLKTTIQPLVENFVKHGLNNNQQVNIISVKCYAVKDEIWIDVQDNGRGMEADKLSLIQASLMKKQSTDGKVGALLNIHERLSIHFAENYGLVLVSSSDKGTLIRLKIPWSKGDGGEKHDEN